jgi:hypothetical protein
VFERGPRVQFEGKSLPCKTLLNYAGMVDNTYFTTKHAQVWNSKKTWLKSFKSWILPQSGSDFLKKSEDCILSEILRLKFHEFKKKSEDLIHVF